MNIHPIQNLFDTAREIFELSPQLCTSRLDTRLKVANLLELIGHILDDTKNKFQSGKLTAGKSQQIAMLSEELYFRLTLSVGEIKALSLSSNLREGYEALQGRGKSLAHDHVIMLDQIINFFLESSNKLRASMSGSD